MSAALIALALFGFGHPPQIATRHYATHGWRIEVQRDRFTGAVTCALSKGRASYRRGAMVFQLDEHTDTTQAMYRIDGGPAKAASTDVLSVEQGGLQLNRGPLDNPSGGQVAAPAAQFKDARLVFVRASRDAQPRRFDLTGFSDALGGAQRVGCDPDHAF